MYKKLGLIAAVLAVAIALYLLAVYKPWQRGTAPEDPPLAEQPQAGQESTPYVSPIDFQALQRQNPDIYAWLDIPGTEISYPVVQNEDDTYYLKRDTDGNHSENGSIFSESAYNGRSGDDAAVVLYGHHMRSGAMFGNLQQLFSDPASFSEHSELVLYYPDREQHYEVFAAVPYDNRHILYTYNFENQRMRSAFLESIYGVRAIGAVLNADAFPGEGDQLLILSTCLQGDNRQRYLVLGKCTGDNSDTAISGTKEETI